MALKIELKPNERILLGGCVVSNTDQRARLLIEGTLPILREKDIMSLGRADTLAKLIYLAVQFIYTARRPRDHHALYYRLSGEFLKAAPSAKPYIEAVNNRILTGGPYKALRKPESSLPTKRNIWTCTTPATPTRRQPWKRRARGNSRRTCYCKPRRNCRLFIIPGPTNHAAWTMRFCIIAVFGLYFSTQ